MVPGNFAKRAALRLCLTLIVATPLVAWGQSTPFSAAPAGDRQAVQSGVELEHSGRWLPAIEHYEDSLKSWPDNKELQYGLRRSKIHFGIERRYSDASFERTLLSKSRRDALDLFDEILSQVRVHFVEPLSSTSFVAHGTESLYLALANDQFRARHLKNATDDRVRQLRTALRDRFWNRPCGDRDEARRVVEEVVDLSASTVGLSPGAVVMEYVFGGCNALDDYSNYLTPDRLNDLYGNIEGEFVGLGIEMKADLGKGLLLVNVLPESPAEEGGLRKGDYIVRIDGVDSRNMTTDEAAKRLRGVPNSRVRLGVVASPDAPMREGEFVRRAVHVKSVPIAKMVDREKGIGYLKLAGFQKTTATEMDAALQSLNRQGMKALIWDLRGNPGGLLTTAVEVLDRFIEDGVLVSTRGRTEDQNWTYSAHRLGTWNVPLVLLVDGESASASEIVAGAVHDHRRGTIVGRQTYGKWSVQSIFPIRNETGLRLTTARFYSPHGRTLGKIGVRPDVVVDLSKERTSNFRGPEAERLEDDVDVRAGLDVLAKQLAGR